MRVRMGWSGEVENNVWQKFDVELEQEDLLRLFRENDLPAVLSDKLPTAVCFRLMQNEAEMLLLGKLRDYGFPNEKANARIAVLLGSSHEIVGAIRKQLAPA